MSCIRVWLVVVSVDVRFCPRGLIWFVWCRGVVVTVTSAHGWSEATLTFVDLLLVFSFAFLPPKMPEAAEQRSEGMICCGKIWENERSALCADQQQFLVCASLPAKK